jgi:hypothetical protein
LSAKRCKWVWYTRACLDIQNTSWNTAKHREEESSAENVRRVQSTPLTAGNGHVNPGRLPSRQQNDVDVFICLNGRAGNKPDSLLLSNRSVVNWVKLANPSGMLPVNLFPLPICRSVNFVKADNAFGMLPNILLLPNMSVVSSVSAPISSGIEPDMLFKYRLLVKHMQINE